MFFNKALKNVRTLYEEKGQGNKNTKNSNYDFFF